MPHEESIGIIYKLTIQSRGPSVSVGVVIPSTMNAWVKLGLLRIENHGGLLEEAIGWVVAAWRVQHKDLGFLLYISEPIPLCEKTNRHIKCSIKERNRKDKIIYKDKKFIESNLWLDDPKN